METTKVNVLVVDDAPPSIDKTKLLFEELGYQVKTASSCELALGLCEHNEFDIAYIDYDMNPHNGIETGRLLREKLPGIVLFILSQWGEEEYIVEALDSGFNDYIVKSGLSAERLKISLIKARKFISDAKYADELRSQYQSSLSPNMKIVGTSRAIKDVIQQARRVAQSDIVVLLNGESGTGKEVLARYIHNESERNKEPFVAINCAQLPKDLVESELFGHVKGAFSGAYREKKGRFELADKGIILLDEIAELSPDVQAKLLRVLQEKQVDRVGGDKPISVDFRLIAATNKNLEEMVSLGMFREDLYYRIKVMKITLPPLRDRQGDIPLLAMHFIDKYGGKEGQSISSAAMRILEVHAWPGNIRELDNAIYHAVVLAGGMDILPEHLPPDVQQRKTGTKMDGDDILGEDTNEQAFDLVFPEELDKFDCDYRTLARYLKGCLKYVLDNPAKQRISLAEVERELGSKNAFKVYLNTNPDAVVCVIQKNMRLLKPILPVIRKCRVVAEALVVADIE